MKYELQIAETACDGEQVLTALSALANPHRLRIVARLADGGQHYVSQLARDLGISRPLLHLHVQKLQEAGLVTSRLELSDDGKALNYLELAPFRLDLTADSVRRVTQSLPAPGTTGD
jgi:DNA-binding transcriptional ArsR family regulator